MNPEILRAWAVRRICLGVDAGGRTIRVVRALRWGPWRFWAPLELPAAVQAAGAPRGAPAVAAGLSPRECLARWIEVPLADRGKARRVLPSLLDVDLPFPLETCEWGVAAMERTTPRTCRGLAVAARREDLIRRIDDLKSAGFDPDILDSEALALWTQSRQEWGTATDWRIVALAGDDRLTCAVGRGAAWVAAYSTLQPQGGALVNWLKSVIPVPNESVEWIWCGPGLREPGGMGACRPALEALFPGRSREVDRPEYFLARAYAFRALAPEALPCNLRSGVLAAERHLRRHARRWMQLWMAVGGVALLLVALNLQWRYEMDRANERLQRQITAEASALAGHSLTREKGVEVRVAERAVLARGPAGLSFERALAPPILASLKTLLDLAAAQSIQIEEVTLDGSAVSIIGSGADWETCERWGRKVEEAGYRSRLERRDAAPVGRVGFQLKPGGG
jgi:hypothetical protein